MLRGDGEERKRSVKWGREKANEELRQGRLRPERTEEGRACPHAVISRRYVVARSYESKLGIDQSPLVSGGGPQEEGQLELRHSRRWQRH
jgi:hypothetical protein